MRAQRLCAQSAHRQSARGAGANGRLAWSEAGWLNNTTGRANGRPVGEGGMGGGVGCTGEAGFRGGGR